MEDLSILSLKIFFFIELIKTLLRKAKQCVYYSICFILTIINLKIVTQELFGLTDLTRAKTFYIYKLSEVIIVSKNKELVFAAF